jgi:pyruvate/2-oxoglutarate dehydrogenase complex dihydrolipoamide acyltransferase (E2) component
MPLFRRSDGDLVKDESPVRRMIPYLMRGRNESAIYHTELIDMSKLRPWMRAYNRAHVDEPITLFHLVLFGISKALQTRPGLNRFVSGGRIYQRRGTWLSFAAKKKMDAKAPLVTVKLEFPETETFGDCVKRIKESIGEGRSDRLSTVDKELKFFLALPHLVLRGVIAIARFLDRMNLMPASMIKSDPMFTSAFVANLGSVGIDRTYHHLYEWGNASLFAVIGVPRKVVTVGAGEKLIVKEMVEVRWTFDERINDGFYCALAMKHAAKVLEDPEKMIGPPGPATEPTNGEVEKLPTDEPVVPSHVN